MKPWKPGENPGAYIDRMEAEIDRLSGEADGWKEAAQKIYVLAMNIVAAVAAPEAETITRPTQSPQIKETIIYNGREYRLTRKPGEQP